MAKVAQNPFRFIAGIDVEGRDTLRITRNINFFGGRYVEHVLPFVIQRFDEGEFMDPVPEPALTDYSDDNRYVYDFLQGALDAAWGMGLRPSQATAPMTPPAPTPGCNATHNVAKSDDDLIAAKDAHIADMRSVTEGLITVLLRNTGAEQ